MSHREEAPGKTQDTLERLCLSAGLGTPQGVPPEELEEVSGVREVWASLLRLLPPCDPVPDQADEDGWMDGCPEVDVSGLTVKIKKIGCNAVSWAPAVVPGSLIDQPSGQKPNYVKRFVSGGCDNLVKLWKEEDGQWKEDQKLEAHSDWVRDVGWAPSIGLPTSTIASCSQDGHVFIWTCDDPAGNTWTAKLLHKFNDVVWHVSWSITGNILAVSGGDNKAEDGGARSSAAASRAPGVKPPISTFWALLGRLLAAPGGHRTGASAARRTEGKRKRCARKQKRGKWGGLLARLKANAGRPPIPSLFLSNVRSLDNKLDLLRLRLGVSREMRNCAVLCLTETWLNDNMMDPASSSTAGFSSVRTATSSRGKPAGADYAST
ncbi:hypothetical protein L3Q82_024384 [Scortum barcoo]|uniref:Uncharacterized protein n=1 Tax=Scortum barcoo TaxID=214431 RepID=A0ACB8WNF4_9TELE|nr:hypothetical protein L3Q82_024384 [Scortum barcoo]